MRILHTEASIGWGGQEIRILTESQAFLRNGHVVRLVADPTSEIFRRAPEFAVPVVALPMRKKRLGNTLALRAILKEFRPDVVNVHSSIDHWLTAWARIGLKPRPAVVKTRHISVPLGRSPLTRWLYRRGADHVVTTGRFITDQIVGSGMLPASRVISIPTGIDLDRFRPGDRDGARAALGLPRDRFICVITATLRRGKGHAQLLDALAELRRADLLLLVVGDGPQRENLDRRIATLGLASSVVMAGLIKDVVPYFHAADAFVLPTFFAEGVPQALRQALACGLRALVSDTGPLREVIERFPSIRTVPPDDVGALVRALAALADEGPAPPATDPVPAEFGTDAMYAEMHALFEAVVARAARP